jgi:hypothetical protein
VRVAPEYFLNAFTLTWWVPISLEMVPRMVKSGLALGRLPDIKAVIAWIPIDEAARAIVELTFVSSQRPPFSTPKYRHIVHPHPVPWLDIWKPIAAHLERLSSKPVRLVPYDDWLGALHEVAAAPYDKDGHKAAAQVNPAIKLLTTYDRFSCARLEELAGGKGAEAVDSLGIRRLETRSSEEDSDVLRHVSKLSATDVNSWILGWIREGFLPTSSPSKL